MGRADIDNVGVIPDTVLRMVETDHLSYPAFGQQVLQQDLKRFHGHRVVGGVVKSEVADLNWRLASEHIDFKENTLAVTPARSSRKRIVLAMLRPVCLFLRRLNPISAAFSERHPVVLSEQIQCAVSPKNAAIFPFDQTSAVKLIRPQDSY